MIYKSDINKFTQNIEEFVIAKNKIEQYLIDSNIIDKKMEIKEFFDYFDLSHSIFIPKTDKSEAIAFQIINLNDDNKVILYNGSNNEDDNEELFNILESIKYNLKSLKKIEETDIILNNIKLCKFFVIDDNFYMVN